MTEYECIICGFMTFNELDMLKHLGHEWNCEYDHCTIRTIKFHKRDKTIRTRRQPSSGVERGEFDPRRLLKKKYVAVKSYYLSNGTKVRSYLRRARGTKK